MTYDPKSVIAELEDYQERAEAAFQDGIETYEELYPYGSGKVKKTWQEAPNEITIETIDDVLPLSFYFGELIYRLTSINGDQATYKDAN